MRALSLDDSLAKGHLALADAFRMNDWNWVGAEREYNRALELDPNSAEAHCSYAGLLDSVGRFEEGLKELEIQLQLDPDLGCPEISPLVPLETQIDREQRFIGTHRVTDEHYWKLALLLWKAGRYKESTGVWQSLMTRNGYTAVAQAMRRGFAKNGYSGSVRELVMAGESVAQQRYVDRIGSDIDGARL